MGVVLKLLLVGLLSLVSFGVAGCGSSPQPQKSGKPAWVLNPNYNGKRGAVGVAGKTYDQRASSQRKLAIQRALDELAMQQGVKVDLVMSKEEHLRNSSASTSMDSSSQYKTTNKKSITAHIEDIWQDPYTGELYVWLVLD